MIQKKKKKLENAAEEDPTNQSRVPVAVYITFQTLGDLKSMKKLIANNSTDIRSKILLTRLEFKECPPPGSIVWENRRVGINSRLKQLLRWVIFVLFIYLMLFLCYEMQLWLRSKMNLMVNRYGFT